MSVPAAKASPAARTTNTRTVSSASTRSHASTSASYIGHVRAFRACGRLNVRNASGPAVSNGASGIDTDGASPMTTRTALEGIRVLDVTQVMAGPFCAMQLCDMGADVIKVEPPSGDSTRRMAGASSGDSAGFNAVNRGKRGIVLDLGAPGG